MDIKGAIDAPIDYELKIEGKASARACRHLKLKDPDNCYGARLFRFSDPKIKAAQVWLHSTFLLFHGEPVPFKYDNGSLMHRLAKLNDQGGRWGMLKALRIIETVLDADKVIRLLKPRKRTSYEYLRSDEFRKKRRENYQKNKNKKVRRRYTTPTSIGLRSGTGKAHTWEKE